MLLRIFLLLVILTSILSKNSYSSYFFYEIYLGPIKVGESQISILKISNTLSAKVYSTGLGNMIYPYYATWETKVEKNGYPIQTIIYSKERGKERKKILHFDSKNSVVYEEKFLPKKKTKRLEFLFLYMMNLVVSFLFGIGVNYLKNLLYLYT